jgi:excisionase family DNA binding protein
MPSIVTSRKAIKHSTIQVIRLLTITPDIGYNMSMEEDIYSVDEAAQKLGLDSSQVRRLLRSGNIKGKKLGHDWVVLSLDYQRERVPKGGRVMPTVRIRLDFTIGIGRRAPRTRGESMIVQLLEGGAMTIRELVEQATFGGKMPRSMVERIIKGAVAAGVLIAFSM